VDEEKPTAIIWQEWADCLAEFDEQLAIERGAAGKGWVG
jgi:hypothetical protein